MPRHIRVTDLNIEMFHGTSIVLSDKKWASTGEHLSLEVFEQQLRRPACAADQRLCYSFFGEYHI